MLKKPASMKEIFCRQNSTAIFSSKRNDLNYESKKSGLHVNLAKTEEMRINNKSNNTIMLENQTIRKVADLTYVGSHVFEKMEEPSKP
jgi:hypothetical protein